MVDWMPGNVGLGTFVDEDKDDHEMLDFALIYVSTHNVYYVKLCIMVTYPFSTYINAEYLNV